MHFLIIIYLFMGHQKPRVSSLLAADSTVKSVDFPTEARPKFKADVRAESLNIR